MEEQRMGIQEEVTRGWRDVLTVISYTMIEGVVELGWSREGAIIGRNITKEEKRSVN